MKSLMIVAAPRTGTNYLLNLLHFDPEFKIFHEIFHPEEAYGLDPISIKFLLARIKTSTSYSTPKELTRIVRAQPEATFDALIDSSEAAGAKTMVFKVFPGHLHGDGVRKLMKRADAVLFVKRPVIDTYISVVKALKVGAYFGVDTTDLRPELDPIYFQEWYGWTQSWYLDTALAWMSQNGSSELPVIRFQEFTGGKSDAENFSALQSLLSIRCAIDLHAPLAPIAGAISRQDRGGTLSERVRNLDAFFSSIGTDQLRRTIHGYF